MVKQNWTVERMFRTTEKFITDLGLDPMPADFWNKSLMVKPKDRPVMCQPAAFDFFNTKDYRLEESRVKDEKVKNLMKSRVENWKLTGKICQRR